MQYDFYGNCVSAIQPSVNCVIMELVFMIRSIYVSNSYNFGGINLQIRKRVFDSNSREKKLI